MDIKKCKVEKNCEWSAAVVKGLAVTLGMSALVSLEGCANNAAKTGDDLAKSISPSSSSELSSSSISDSSNANSTNSSSSSDDSGSKDERTEEDLYYEKLENQPLGGIMAVPHDEELFPYLEELKE